MSDAAETNEPDQRQAPAALLRMLKLWVWFVERIEPSELQVTLAWAGVVGFLGAVASIAFRWLVNTVHLLFTGNAANGIAESFAHLTWWQRLLTPVFGGAIAGVVIFFGTRWRGEVTTTDYMEAVVLGDGKISLRLSIIKCLSAMFTIASGGSIGREGPLVQLSCVLASITGRLRNWSTPRLRLLVGCGAAAGIASAYNAPIAGALFVAEIVLGSLAMEIFGPLVFASVVATLTVRGFLGGNPLYEIPPFQLNSTWEIVPHFFLGVLAGFVAPWFLWLLRWSERLFARVPAPVYVRLALGGLAVGLLAVMRPEVCGNGYSAVNAILRGDWVWQSLAVILVFKMIATAATFGSGAVGGVFTPTLFVGSSLGYLFGYGLRHFGLAPMASPSAFAIVGMGAFLAATTHAPIMAIIMIFELTLDYQIILPLMLGCVVAYYISVGLEKNSIYTEALKRKGAGSFRRQFADLRVRDLMKPESVFVAPTAHFAEIGQKFIANRFNYLYVVDDARHFLGAVSLHDIKSYLNEPQLAELVIARDIMHERFPAVDPNVSLSEALEKFARHDGERLPVVASADGNQLIGSISKTDLVLALAGAAKPHAPAV